MGLFISLMKGIQLFSLSLWSKIINRNKTYSAGTRQEVYYIFIVYTCVAWSTVTAFKCSFSAQPQFTFNIPVS